MLSQIAQLSSRACTYACKQISDHEKLADKIGKIISSPTEPFGLRFYLVRAVSLISHHKVPADPQWASILWSDQRAQEFWLQNTRKIKSSPIAVAEFLHGICEVAPREYVVNPLVQLKSINMGSTVFRYPSSNLFAQLCENVLHLVTYSASEPQLGVIDLDLSDQEPPPKIDCGRITLTSDKRGISVLSPSGIDGSITLTRSDSQVIITPMPSFTEELFHEISLSCSANKNCTGLFSQDPFSPGPFSRALITQKQLSVGNSSCVTSRPPGVEEAAFDPLWAQIQDKSLVTPDMSSQLSNVLPPSQHFGTQLPSASTNSASCHLSNPQESALDNFRLAEVQSQIPTPRGSQDMTCLGSRYSERFPENTIGCHDQELETLDTTEQSHDQSISQSFPMETTDYTDLFSIPSICASQDSQLSEHQQGQSCELENIRTTGSAITTAAIACLPGAHPRVVGYPISQPELEQYISGAIRTRRQLRLITEINGHCDTDRSSKPDSYVTSTPLKPLQVRSSQGAKVTKSRKINVKGSRDCLRSTPEKSLQNSKVEERVRGPGAENQAKHDRANDSDAEQQAEAESSCESSEHGLDESARTTPGLDSNSTDLKLLDDQHQMIRTYLNSATDAFMSKLERAELDMLQKNEAMTKLRENLASTRFHRQQKSTSSSSIAQLADWISKNQWKPDRQNCT